MSGEAPTDAQKKFSIPSREEVIQAIKESDDNIEHISLNLIKCNFDATEADVRTAFPEYNFLKVKNYNPGSFEVIFNLKIDAINFVKNSPGKKILGRYFMVKMGRNNKTNNEWFVVQGEEGSNQYKGHKKPYHNNQGNPNPANKFHANKPKVETTAPGNSEEAPQAVEATQVEQKPQHKEYKKFDGPRPVRPEPTTTGHRVIPTDHIVHKQHKEHKEHKEEKEHKEQKEHKESKEQKPVAEGNNANTVPETTPAEQKPYQPRPKKEEVKIEEHADYKPRGFVNSHKAGTPSTSAKPAPTNTTATTTTAQTKQVQVKPAPTKAPEAPKKVQEKKKEAPPAAEDDGWIVVDDKRGKKKGR